MKEIDLFHQFLQKTFECYAKGELHRSLLYLNLAINHLKKLIEKDKTKP